MAVWPHSFVCQTTTRPSFGECGSYLIPPHDHNILSSLQLAMPKGKKRVRDENANEYKTANVRFKNPFTQTLDYTLTSASAEGSTSKTIQETRTVAYNPPPRPIHVETPHPPISQEASATLDSKTKTQASGT